MTTEATNVECAPAAGWPCPIDVTREDPVRALHVFAMLGSCRDVAALLDAGVDVDARDSAGCTALARAAGGEISLNLTQIDAVLAGVGKRTPNTRCGSRIS